MFNVITEIFSVIKSPLTEWLKNRQEVAKAQHELELEIIKFKQKQAADELQYTRDWELASLNASSGTLRNVSFFSWYVPIFIAIFFPEYAKEAMENLKLLPDWYIQGFLVVNFAVWGISVSRATVTGIVMGAIKMVADRPKRGTQPIRKDLDLPPPFE